LNLSNAVLLGDLVGSTRLSPARLNQVMAALASAAEALGPVAGDTHFTRFRGDGWQLVTFRAETALRAALYLSARLKAEAKAETRIAIGLGTVDRLDGPDLGTASGTAFLRSGQALDTMPRGRRMLLAGAPAAAGIWIDALLTLLEQQIAGWSAPQAEAVALALEPGWSVQEDLADRLGITRQAMNARLKGAGFAAVEAALDAFEGFDWDRKDAA
jgi:hypothetical protein